MMGSRVFRLHRELEMGTFLCDSLRQPLRPLRFTKPNRREREESRKGPQSTVILGKLDSCVPQQNIDIKGDGPYSACVGLGRLSSKTA